MGGKGFIIDFEKAMRSALLKVIPGINVLGCWFHFCQSLRRKMASLQKLHELIRRDCKAKDLFRRFKCLAMLPASLIESVFTELSREALKPSPHFSDSIDYSYVEWIRRVKPQHFFCTFANQPNNESS